MQSKTIWRRGMLLAAGLGASAAAAGAQTLTATVTAAQHDYREVPVSLVVPAERVPAPGAAVPAGATPCQSESAGQGRVRLTWIVRDLKRGQSRTYTLAPTSAKAGAGVEVKRSGGNVDVVIGGKLFTRYDTTTGPNKPYFYPVYGPGGALIVRHLPEEKVAGETTDHPHHRGISFTHGEMNGVDFWTEQKGAGKTVHTGYGVVTGGPVYGRLEMTADWITPDGKKIAEDRRDVYVYPVQNGTLMDFAITVRAVGGPLVWGDTKEGTFSIRVPDSMRANAGKDKVAEGHIVNARGDKQADTWGKAAAWCDYWGPVDGQTLGIAILDDPQNPRHPTTWHVRDYGLFAVNPFGLHEFDPALKNNRHAGDLTTPENETTTFRYRIFFHEGDTDAAHIPAVWDAYAEPPAVTLGSGGAAAADTGKTGAWQSLFDGKSLAGWERKAVHGGEGGVWTVENGVLVGDQETDHKGGLLGTLQTYGDAEITLEFRADFPTDSGLFLRTTPTGDAYQVTIDNKPGDGTIGSIYVPSSGFVARDEDWRKKFKKDDWNTLRAVITGQPAHVQVWLNGQQTVDFTDARERLPRTGYVGLQVHGGNGAWGENSRIRFRSVRIRPL